MNQSKQKILCLLKKENKSFWNLLGNLSLSRKELIEELNFLHKEKLVETKNYLISLTEKGIKETENLLVPIEWNKEYEKELLEEFLKATENRPKALAEFDQGIMRSKDSVNRTIIMGKNFDVDGKNILIIGDDDLVCIALALTKRANKIIVLEIDKRLNDFINVFAEKNSLPLKALTWSAEEDLLPEFRKQFDVFLSDPVETIEGIKLFLGRGMSSLKGIDSVFYFGLTRIDSSAKKWSKIQKMIFDSGFIFTDIIKDQAFYPCGQFQDFHKENKFSKTTAEFPLKEKAEETYFRSNFLRCLAVKEIILPVKGSVKLNERMYWDEEIL